MFADPTMCDDHLEPHILHDLLTSSVDECEVPTYPPYTVAEFDRSFTESTENEDQSNGTVDETDGVVASASINPVSAAPATDDVGTSAPIGSVTDTDEPVPSTSAEPSLPSKFLIVKF